MVRTSAGMMLAVALTAPTVLAQVVGTGSENARPISGDPGVSWMQVLDHPEYRVLRDHCEPGATRSMHAHETATYHVFTLVTGQLELTIEGQEPIQVGQGDVLHLDGGVMHGFTNTGDVAATIVEVFGKATEN